MCIQIVHVYFIECLLFASYGLNNKLAKHDLLSWYLVTFRQVNGKSLSSIIGEYSDRGRPG